MCLNANECFIKIAHSHKKETPFAFNIRNSCLKRVDTYVTVICQIMSGFQIIQQNVLTLKPNVDMNFFKQNNEHDFDESP